MDDTWADVWDRKKTYAAGDRVIYGGWEYEAMRDTQPGDEPFIGPETVWRCTNFDEISERIKSMKVGG